MTLYALDDAYFETDICAQNKNMYKHVEKWFMSRKNYVRFFYPTDQVTLVQYFTPFVHIFIIHSSLLLCF